MAEEASCGTLLKSWTAVRCAQFMCILLSLTGVILISFSLNHDVKWNSWVDEHFNLNQKNANHMVRIDDYSVGQSQQEWIELLQRVHPYDKLYLYLTVSAALLLTLLTISCTPNHILSGFVYALCGLAFLVGGSLLLRSMMEIDDDEDKIASLVLHLSKKHLEGDFLNEMDSILAGTEVGESMKSIISCRTADQHSSIVNNCQMYSIKALAVSTAFLNLIACFFLTCSSFLTLQGFFEPLEPDQGAEGIVLDETRHYQKNKDNFQDIEIKKEDLSSVGRKFRHDVRDEQGAYEPHYPRPNHHYHE